MADYTEINPRFIMWLVIGLVLCSIFVVSLLPAQPQTNTTQNNTVYITKTEYIKILVTPTPDGITFFSNEYQTGLRRLARPFTWYRSDVIGKQDMRVTARAYNAIILDKVHWFNPVDYKYYEYLPQTSDSKFLFVLFNIYQDNEIADDTRLWLPAKDMFGIQIRDTMYYPIDYKENLRFKELENTYNFNDDGRVKAYGQYPSYSRKMTNDTLGSAGEISVKEYYLRGGKSNAQDGYILFEIPKNAEIQDCVFRASFYSFGESSWKLTD